MDYYVREVQIGESVKKTAGSKARDDLNDIMQKLKIQAIDIPSRENKRQNSIGIQKILEHFRIIKIWESQLKVLKENDRIFIQFPVIEHSVLFASFLKRLQKRGTKVILIIHDLELLRFSKREDIKYRTRLRLRVEENDVLKCCNQIIVHNDKMKKFLKTKGIDENKMIVLKLFDYLIPQFDYLKTNRNKAKKEDPIIIAGALKKHKAGYIYKISDRLSVNLYGIGYETCDKKNLNYKGAFKPDELPYIMEGSFGLVWDGVSAKTCEGIYGNYLRVNNPHKTSLYLASGIPVIIWKEAALADFIEKQHCGILVDSIDDITEKIKKMSDQEYCEMQKNVCDIGKKIRDGYFYKKALESVK